MDLGFSRKVLHAALIVAGVVLAVLLAWQISYVILITFSAILLAILLRSIMQPLRRYLRLSDGASIICVIVILLLAGTLLFSFLTARVETQIERLSQTVPKSLEQIEAYLRTHAWAGWAIERGNLKRLLSASPLALGTVTSALGRGAGIIISAFVVFSLALYFAVHPQVYIRGSLALIPYSERPLYARLFSELGTTLRGWLLGQLITMSIIGVLTGIGLYVLDVPLALTLGLLAFVLDFVPYFGPIAAAVPGILFALAENPAKALYVTLLYLAVQQFEGIVVSPLVQKRTISIPPVLTIISITLFGLLFGFLGFLLAAPLMAATLVLVRVLYLEQLIEREAVESPTPQSSRPRTGEL